MDLELLDLVWENKMNTINKGEEIKSVNWGNFSNDENNLHVYLFLIFRQSPR